MTLAQAAGMLSTSPKWVQNALTQLGFPLAYPELRIRQLGLTRRMVDAGFSLGAAWVLAGQALKAPYHPLLLPINRDLVQVAIDVPRFLTEWAAAKSRITHVDPPRERGRPHKPARRGGVALARAYGIDISSLVASLRKTPAERIKMLDANQQFVARLRARR